MCSCCGAPPDLLTVAEAQRVLRMGRTKMYELVREWRETDGASGLRVIELGNALRVPRVALEELIGAPVHVPPEPAAALEPQAALATPTLVVAASNDAPEPAPASRQRRSRRPGTVPVSQLDLFDPPAAS
jgi:hypothetical protein